MTRPPLDDSELLEDLYEDGPCGYLSTLPDGTIVKVNRTFEQWTGHRREALLGTRRFQDLLSAGGRIYHETHYRPLLQMQGSVREIALDIECADGRRLPVLVNSTMRRDADGRPGMVRTTVFDATDRRAYERELVDARRRAEALQRDSALLAEVSRVLDVHPALVDRAEELLALLVQEGARGALLSLAAGEEPVAAAGAAGDADLAEALARSLTTGEAGTHGGAAAAPLVVHGELVGALAVCGAAAERPQLLEAIADRAAVALDNARLYERERAVALTLQRSLLAGDLPDDPRCAIGTHYAPAVHTLAVGGDWYDAFASGPGHLMVVVGDVVGKGLDAAATMGQVRSALKALAVAGLGPQEVLEMLDLFVDHTEQARGATIVLVEIELATGTARLACAGHPPPVLLPYGGEPELLWEGRSAPLGAYAGVRTRSEATLTLEPGARLLLYSDGVVERRDRPIDVGIEALTAAFARRRDEPVATVGSALDAELMPEQHGADDVCMLAVMFAAPPDFERRVDGDVDALPGLRADLRAWLAAHAVEGEDRDAIVLACSEVTANAIEHGLGGGAGSVRITARAADGAVALAVSDDGAWREGSTPGRGRGLAIVEHLMDDLAVERGTGTTVRMRRDLRGGR